MAVGLVVPMPTFPLVVKVVNAPVFGVVDPIVPGTAQLVVDAALVQVLPFDVSTFPDVPGAIACRALVPLPRSTLFAAKVAAPEPPFATLSVPETAADEARLIAPKVGWLEPLTVMT